MFNNKTAINNDTDWDRKLIPVPRLEKMASASVAIALWNHAIVTIPNLLKKDYQERYRLNEDLDTTKWMYALPVPKSLSEPVEHHFCSLRNEVENWISCIYQEVFLTREMRSYIYQLIDDIIWHPNGTIHRAETARNLLKSDKLTIAEKFRVACAYCLREDVERLWPMMEDENDLVVTLRFSEYPLHCYWMYYYADQLNKIGNLGSLSVDEFMIQQPYVKEWPAIEYFFDRLDAEKQVEQAIWLFDKYGSKYLKFILVKLNESQRLRLMMDRVVQIMGNFTSYDSCNDYKADLIISTWYDARDVITEEQFVELFSQLLEKRIEDFVLTEIWKTTPEDLKRRILNYDDDYFIIRLLQWWEWQYKKETFPAVVSSVLMDHVSARIKREITKKKFFSELCEKFIRIDAVKMLNHLINLCLPEEAESTEFKLSVTKRSYFKNHCKKLVFGGKIEELVNLLEFAYSKTNPSSPKLIRKILGTLIRNLDQQCLTYYSAGNLKGLNDLLAPLVSLCPEIISDYKSKLLMSRAGFKVCLNLFGSTSDALNEIIADGFSPDLANKFQKRIIFSPEVIDKLQNMIVDGSLNDAEKWTRWFLESGTDRENLKTQLINRLKKGKCKVHSKIRKRFLEFLT